MKFTKMQGCANDYVYVNCFNEKVMDMGAFAKAVSDRHTGIGSDGAIFICPSDVADCEMKMYNADGSYSEMCGNGIRCVAKYVYDYNIIDKTELNIASGGKIKKVWLEVEKEEPKQLSGLKFSKREDGMAVSRVKVDMGEPILECEEIPVKPNIKKEWDSWSDEEVVIPDDIAADLKNRGINACIGNDLDIDGTDYKMTCVSMGNPHCVIYVDDVSSIKIEKVGPKFENNECFPNRVNTEFTKVVDRKNVNMRVWERGAGETLACGTGACAVAVSSILNGFVEDEVTIHLLGGDLEIFWDRKGTNHVYMTGAAVTVFEGEI